jgi:hypothetical protein
MGAASKRAKKVRIAREFDLARLEARLRQPRDGRTTIDAWALEDIFTTREEQLIGQFLRPSRMAEQMRTDDALFTAYHNRLAPQRCIPRALEPAPGARGAAVCNEADAQFGPCGVAVLPDTLADIHGCLVNHGVAFACCTWLPRDDGSRVDVEVNYWPIEYFRWDPVYRVFRVRVDPNTLTDADMHDERFNEFGYAGAAWLPVVHGDGRWLIFKKNEIEPFRQDACLLAGALVWARHAFANRDWAKGSVAHGNAKVVGTLPQGVALQDQNGPTAEAEAFIALMRSIASDDSPAGIKPFGSEVQFLTNNSTAWQVWAELVNNADKAAARIYLGTDGTLGAQGGAPGVDITALFGVAATKVRGDLECIQRGLNTGVIEQWTAINFGDSKLAPSLRYLVPNDEAEATRKNTIERTAAFYAALKTARDAGLTLTPVYIAKLAADYDVRVPELAGPIAPPPTPGQAAPVKSGDGSGPTPGSP